MSPKQESWAKKNIFPLISLGTMLIGAFVSGILFVAKLQTTVKDVDNLKKEVKELQAVKDVKSITTYVDDQVFKMKTSLYTEIKQIETLFTEKFRNSEKREQEFRQDLKDIQRRLYRIKSVK